MSSFERRLPWIIIAAATLAGIGGYLLSQRVFDSGSGPTAPAQLAGSLLYPQPKALPEFTLLRSDGTALRAQDWRGRWRLLFFGFASCPEICPTTLATTKAALARLKIDRPDLDVAVSFISLDPERDTPEKLGAYVSFFNPAFEAATGTPDQLRDLAAALGVMFMKVANGPGPFDYTIDHSASMLIIDPQGRVAGLMRPPLRADVMAADLAQLAGPRGD